jgi:hypothetical protein
VLHYVTKVWSDVPRDWPGLQPHAGGQRLHLDHTLTGGPQQRHGPMLSGAAGTGIILAGYSGRPPEKRTVPAVRRQEEGPIHGQQEQA